MGPILTCDICGEPSPAASTWYGVKGYEQPREGGGANHIALRRRTGELVCDGCMRKMQAGIAPNQDSLLA